MKHSEVHYHADEYGLLRRCYHVCRHWLVPGFLAGWLFANTITFPVEHLMWDHVWPYYTIGDWLGRINHLQIAVSIGWNALLILCVLAGIRYVVKA